MKYMACLVMLLTAFAACSPDSDASDPGSITNKTYTLHFNLSPVSGSSASSRAETYTAGSPNTWEDGSKEENMKSWTVVFVKSSDGTVAKVVKQPSVAEGKDKKDDVTVTGLEAGTTYTVYSFANISDADLGTITEGSSSPNFDSKSFAVNGNDWNIANGIPMSNKQEVIIGSNGQPNVKDLYVVRMLSKITLKFRNMTGKDITVNEVSISDITSNPATGTENIMLLPKTSVSSADVAQAPNLVENAASGEFTHTISRGLTVANNTTYDTDNSRSVSFYVNESQAGNVYPYFVVTLKTSVGSQRYFMYTDWNKIARNDHHVLKLALSDYKLRLKIEDFGSIGSTPSLKDDGKQLNLIFHDLEEFHIVPSVTKYSDESSSVSFTNLEWTRLSESETGAESKAFSTIPSIVSSKDRIEAETKGELGKKIGPIIYQLSVKVNDGTTTAPTLVYRVAITQDLTWYSARRHNGAFWICKQ
jgi:hypothetical protein